MIPDSVPKVQEKIEVVPIHYIRERQHIQTLANKQLAINEVSKLY
ncbi:hypothetical protein BXY41_101609 [Lacrimispora xylanisolvens]|uniref:Uncharacterized protein n=1 Tax=Lacrimispora xylanisolvens TaxID=384636 RepID=A0A2S6HZF5_9FIRM|nr:hypothetical protein BXY41_101609 [Hungatella xylanolytica]